MSVMCAYGYHECPWLFIGIHGCVRVTWVIIGVHGMSWVSMCLWVSMSVYRILWVCTGIYGCHVMVTYFFISGELFDFLGSIRSFSILL